MLLFNYCTFDDYLQIQALLKYEQRRRELAIQQHMQQQHQEALRKRRVQQYRLARAMHNLKALKENYRRERAYQIQRYMEHYRDQQLIAAVEDAFYRQCLASAIEQRRADVIRQRYQQIEQKKSNYHQQQQQETTHDEVEDFEEDKGFEDYHANQLADILRQLFNGQIEQQVKQEESQQQQPVPEQKQAEQPLNDPNDQEEAHDLWNYITHLQDEQQDQEQPEQKKEEEEEEEPKVEKMEQVEEEPAFIKQHQTETTASDSNDYQDDNDDYDDDMINNEVNKVFQRQAVPQQTREPEVINVIDKNNRMDASKQPYLENWDNPHQFNNLNNDAEHQQEPDPPLQDRVLNLKDLLDELVSDESSDPTTNTMDSPHQSNITSPEHDENDSAKNDDDDDDMNLFEPKQIVTDAEPTPQPELATTATAADVDPIPPPVNQHQHHHHHHHHHHEQPDEDFVHKIAEQQKHNVPPADPAKYEELQKVDRELDDIRDHRLATVLKTPLHFENKAGTLQVTATTPNNRQFLGCEDEIMRSMLKLDTILSDGDEGIRNERRTLVKKAECMLEQLDEHKQIEWEMARRTNKQQQQHKKKKKNRHNNRQRHNPHRSPQYSKTGGIVV